jgi:hypothetical protein
MISVGKKADRVQRVGWTIKAQAALLAVAQLRKPQQEVQQRHGNHHRQQLALRGRGHAQRRQVESTGRQQRPQGALGCGWVQTHRSRMGDPGLAHLRGQFAACRAQSP